MNQNTIFRIKILLNYLCYKQTSYDFLHDINIFV